MQLIAPHRICRLIGHSREGYDAGHYTDRRGRLRQRRHMRCTRCGTSDGGEVFNEGLFERWTIWHLRVALHRGWQAIKLWWHTDCGDCNLPERRRGRAVGDHHDCLPF
jgi:hypothetical protein